MVIFHVSQSLQAACSKSFQEPSKRSWRLTIHDKSGKNKTQQSVDLNNLLRRYAQILFTDAKWFGRQSLSSLKMSSALDSKYQQPGRWKLWHPKWLEQYVDWKKSKPFWVGSKYSHLQLLHRNCFGHSSDFTLTDVPWVFFVQALNKLGHQLAEPMTALGIHHGTIERYLTQFSPWNFQNKTWKKSKYLIVFLDWNSGWSQSFHLEVKSEYGLTCLKNEKQPNNWHSVPLPETLKATFCKRHARWFLRIVQ